jgi:REP element-mobilizing transposase RayT
VSWVRVWVHMVFSTKYRRPFLRSRSVRRKVFQHIAENAEEKGIWVDCVNGFSDHAHVLISLGREQTISKTAQLIKGESSFWINKNQLLNERFAWQDDYWAVSVSERNLPAVRRYIHNQERHHQRTEFKDEIKKLERSGGLNFVKQS